MTAAHSPPPDTVTSLQLAPGGGDAKAGGEGGGLSVSSPKTSSAVQMLSASSTAPVSSPLASSSGMESDDVCD